MQLQGCRRTLGRCRAGQGAGTMASTLYHARHVSMRIYVPLYSFVCSHRAGRLKGDGRGGSPGIAVQRTNLFHFHSADCIPNTGKRRPRQQCLTYKGMGFRQPCRPAYTCRARLHLHIWIGWQASGRTGERAEQAVERRSGSTDCSCAQHVRTQMGMLQGGRGRLYRIE